MNPLLLATFESYMIYAASLALGIAIIGLLLKRLKQPYLIGYIIVGAVVGNQGFGLVTNTELIHHFGEIGIVLLLFFIGSEINLVEFFNKWKLAALGTAMQVGMSVGLALLLAHFLGWSWQRGIVIGFILSLSSTAVSIKLLEDRGIVQSKTGQNVLSVLLAQDIIIVPLLIITSLIGGSSNSSSNTVLMLIGGAILIAILIYIYLNKRIDLPFSLKIAKDRELQVFLAIIFCFGGALFTSLFHLSAALGAFVGGMVINAARATGWIHNTLHSFRVIFVALFFVSIGMQLNFGFILDNIWILLAALLAVYLTNQLLNSVILYIFGSNRLEAFLGGAYLAQIGELSFLIAATAYTLGLKSTYAYNFTLSLISLTLIVSPFWVAFVERFVAKRQVHETEVSSEIPKLP
jgi:CPA2 family monovalent cation:H+ antiporter-2